MAIVLQEVVGNQYEDVYYPHISGVAQSFNYYPFAHMKPEEGLRLQPWVLGDTWLKGNGHTGLHHYIQCWRSTLPRIS